MDMKKLYKLATMIARETKHHDKDMLIQEAVIEAWKCMKKIDGANNPMGFATQIMKRKMKTVISKETYMLDIEECINMTDDGSIEDTIIDSIENDIEVNTDVSTKMKEILNSDEINKTWRFDAKKQQRNKD